MPKRNKRSATKETRGKSTKKEKISKRGGDGSEVYFVPWGRVQNGENEPRQYGS